MDFPGRVDWALWDIEMKYINVLLLSAESGRFYNTSFVLCSPLRSYCEPREIFSHANNSQFTVWRKEDERTPGLLYRLQYSSRFVTAFFSVSLIITVCKIDRLKQISRNEVYLESRIFITIIFFDTDLISHLY